MRITPSWMLVERGGAPGGAAYAARIESVGAKLPQKRLTTRALMDSTRHHPDIDLERLTGIASGASARRARTR